MYLCLNCLEVYNTPFEHCPKANCDGRIVEIDELILPAIIEFNRKGYITEFCCSGHIHNPYPYVKFDTEIFKEMSEEQYEIFVRLMPESWEFLSISGYDIRYNNKNGWTAEDKTDIETYMNILFANINLYRFALDLPDLKEENK